MNYRTLGKTGFSISEIGLGTWQLGGGWGGEFDASASDRILKTAVEQGLNFFDTADVYDSGHSEAAIGRFLKTNKSKVFVATKCGRYATPHDAVSYNTSNIAKYVEDSLNRLQIECIDLLQLHCPPTDVYYMPEVFGILDTLKVQGKILHYGVSVARVEEALKAIEYEGVASVQIIFNMLRQRPADLFFEQATKRNVGIITRVPLASGLLSGTWDLKTTFRAGDHRLENRNGEWFDKGETFAGLDFETGLEVVTSLKEILGTENPLSIYALKWILMHPQVSVVIPGASRPEQVIANALASEAKTLDAGQLKQIKSLYDLSVKPKVHQAW
jgi:aryl-alcohol dehydrogenase-like predicted oxidoreductase